MTTTRTTGSGRTRQASGDFEEFLYDENGNLIARKLYAASAPTVPFKSTLRGYDFLNRLTTVTVEGDPYLRELRLRRAGEPQPR